ncbi:MAG: long-chain-fatty-acid--CoA ligase [Deltaproteobacteria bacterium]|nr:long-chain-fatty-acid--CoA ligase [Deltaproteobacteria bacterium]
MDRNFGEMIERNAGIRPDKVAVKCKGLSLTFEDLNNRTNRLSNSLLKMGLGKGDRVAVLSRNCSQYVELYWAIAKAGLIIVPINFRLIGKEISFLVNDSGAKAFVSGKEFVSGVESVRGEMPVLTHLIVIGPPSGDWMSYDELIQMGGEDLPPSIVRVEDVLCIMYTSGTTSFPKGAVITHGNWLASARYHCGAFNIGEGDTCLIVNPLFHVAATWPLYSHFYIGGSVVLLPSFDLEEVLSTLDKEKITTFNTVPTIINELLQSPTIREFDFRHLKWIGYGGSTMPLDVLGAAVEIFGNKFFHVYGLTESNGAVTRLPPEDHLRKDASGSLSKIRSCGRAIDPIGVRIVDESGRDKKPHEIGEIVVKGDCVINEYRGLPEVTAQTIQHGWLRTGDLGTIDEEGYFYVVDRKKDIIISGGENISSREVEDVIHRHPGVLEAAVIGVTHPKWGEAVKAVIVKKKGCEVIREEIENLCRKNLAGFKCPKSIDFVDSLPKSSTGKILKREIRKHLGL